MNFSDLKIWGMLERHEFIRVVAFGASNTQRYLPGTHWFDYVDMAFKIHTAAVAATLSIQGSAAIPLSICLTVSIGNLLFTSLIW